MEKDLLLYFQKLGLTNEDIRWMQRSCPGLKMVNSNKAMLCVEALIQHGYPEKDLNWLLTCNPNILMYHPQDLDEMLYQFSELELEHKLKTNPFLI